MKQVEKYNYIETLKFNLYLKYNYEKDSVRWKTKHDIKELNKNHLINYEIF